MSAPNFTLAVESWRGLAHSYAVVGQNLCLAFLDMPDVRLHHRDVPFFGSHWAESKGLFPAEAEARLYSIPPPPPEFSPDATLRIAFPFDFTPVPHGRLCVFVTSENKLCPKNAVRGAGDGNLARALELSGATLLTCSEWSKAGFLRSGAPAERVEIIPLGVDTRLFHPGDAASRATGRTTVGSGPDDFVFLNIGSLAPNKGTLLLLQAFAEVARIRPAVRLVLKFNGALYSARQLIDTVRQLITPAEQAVIAPRLLLTGGQHTLTDMALLYQSADAYVAPYYAEGFNLPALEACASGLPVICTQGGPTDEFLPPENLLKIRSHERSVQKEDELLHILEPDRQSLVEQMLRCVDDARLRETARSAGPVHVEQAYTWQHVSRRVVELLRRPGGSR